MAMNKYAKWGLLGLPGLWIGLEYVFLIIPSWLDVLLSENPYQHYKFYIILTGLILCPLSCFIPICGLYFSNNHTIKTFCFVLGCFQITFVLLTLWKELFFFGTIKM
jgi:hypothetical protein